MIDVRTKQEWDTGFIDGAIHIPLKNLQTILVNILKIITKKFYYTVEVVIDRKAKLILEELGYTNIKNIGGIKDISKI